MAVMRAKSSRSIIKKLVRNLILTISLLLAALVISILMGIFMVSNQERLDSQKSQISDDIAGILRAMLDQETGVRGYINTTDSTFLDPYTSGRTNYLNATQDLMTVLRQVGSTTNSINKLRAVEDRADDWYQNGGQMQIDRVQRGGDSLTQARSDAIATANKARFDSFRQSITDLQNSTQADLAEIQNRKDSADRFIWVAMILIAILAVLGIWFSFNRFVNVLRLQLSRLTEVTTQLEAGDLTVRIIDPTDDELGVVGQNFNAMAKALEQQQKALKQRDIQDSILLLNNTLNTSLELELLLDKFLVQLLSMLQLQVGAIYLYNPQSSLLSVGAVQGFDRSKLQPVFALGEGLIGRAAHSRQPLLMNQVQSDETSVFEVKTILGQVLPATLFYIPLVRGGELLGVLVVGNFQPLSENTQNVLNVISANLAVSISNAVAYRHIQSQAEELERRRHELERNNAELSQQRDELSILNSALEEANRLRNQFLSTMSHELRTPLTAIIGFSQLMLRNKEIENLNIKQKANVERILKNGQHLLGLVNDVLDIAKIEAGRMDVSQSEVSVEPFLGSLVEQTQSLATQKGLKLTYDVAPDIGTIETDSEKLRQIFLNLISNAIKFTEKGEVKITAKLVTAQPGRHGAEQDQVSIAVQDTGIGIPYEKQDRIFEEFYQVDSTSTRKYGGTGLGLSIVRKLTDLLGGTLSLRSEYGKGSTFTVTLPRYARTNQPDNNTSRLNLETHRTPEAVKPVLPEPVKDLTEVPVITMPASALVIDENRRLVLAVDDDPDIVELISEALENTVYQVVGISDPMQVVSKVIELKPYAVTLDVMMPASNGWQILQQLKSNPTTADIPVIMLTVISDRSAGYVLGANDYLIKPIDRDLLLKTLDRFVARRSGNLAGITAGMTLDAQIYAGDNRSLTSGLGRTGYVLVVDDEADIRSVLEQTLSDAGFEVKTAAGGVEALQLVEQTPPGVILLDLMMPDLDGFEVLSRLKSRPDTASVPVIILTAKTLTSQDYERLRWGSSRIIQKGSQPLAVLLEELSQLLRQLKG